MAFGKNKSTPPKKKISKLLSEDRGWRNIKDAIPDVDKLVVIRFTNPHYVYYETDTEIYYAEDLKIAKCTRDYEYPNDISKCTWSIVPPYPKFDYSPLSSFDKLKEGSVVTHWAYASEEDIESWNHRFDISDAYLTLNFDVDDDHAELMYKALMYGTGAIGSAYTQNKSDELLAYHIVMQDLLNSIDKNIMIQYGKEISKNKDYNPAEEDNMDDKVNEELNKVLTSAKPKVDPMIKKSDVIKEANDLIGNLINVIDDHSSFIEAAFTSFFNSLGIPISEVPYFEEF